ncbi:MAG: hypothetical protein IPJ81_02325 [Chitinophagaceae bacterium]|nr:hypothetical protein [Chitinophagaceae bacterium]
MIKNFKTLMAVFCLSYSLVACQSAAEKAREKEMKDEMKAASDKIDARENAPKKNIQFNEEFILDKAKVKVIDYKALDEVGEKIGDVDVYYSKAAKGKKFITFTIEMNDKKEDYFYTHTDLIGPDGTTYNVNEKAYSNFVSMNLKEKNKGLDTKIHRFDGAVFEVDEAEWNKPGWKLIVETANIINIK